VLSNPLTLLTLVRETVFKIAAQSRFFQFYYRIQ